MPPTGYSDLVVVEDSQSLHRFSFTVKLQQTRQSLGVGCWDEEDEEEEKGDMGKKMEKVGVGDKTEEETQLQTKSVIVGIWSAV